MPSLLDIIIDNTLGAATGIWRAILWFVILAILWLGFVWFALIVWEVVQAVFRAVN